MTGPCTPGASWAPGEAARVAPHASSDAVIEIFPGRDHSSLLDQSLRVPREADRTETEEHREQRFELVVKHHSRDNVAAHRVQVHDRR